MFGRGKGGVTSSERCRATTTPSSAERIPGFVGLRPEVTAHPVVAKRTAGPHWVETYTSNPRRKSADRCAASAGETSPSKAWCRVIQPS